MSAANNSDNDDKENQNPNQNDLDSKMANLSLMETINFDLMKDHRFSKLERL